MDQRLEANALSKDRVLSSDRDADQPLCRQRPCFFGRYIFSDTYGVPDLELSYSSSP